MLGKIVKFSLSIFGGTALSFGLAIPAVGCSNSITNYKILPTYTGEADILLSLGIFPDYYPYQLKEDKPFSYITNPKDFMTEQDETFKNKFQQKIDEIMANVTEGGRSWWNMNAQKDSDLNYDPEYWTHKNADLLLYEHYLLDDEFRALEPKLAPTSIWKLETNFRASKDPFTRLSKEQILSHDDNTSIFYENGNIKDGLFNDFVYASNLAHSYENDLFFKNLLLESNARVFDQDLTKDNLISKYYNLATINNSMKNAGLEKINYLNTTHSLLVPTMHHPIYETQHKVGEAPAYEGAIRDNLIYMYNLASGLTDLKKNNDALLKNDARENLIINAHDNAKKIITDFKERQQKVKNYFENIGVKGKTLAIVTIAPGAGEDTIQSNSKYSFLYQELGLNQPWPVNGLKLEPDVKDVTASNEHKGIFAIDDNGWFWDISIGNDGATTNGTNFKNAADFGVISVRDENWRNKKQSEKNMIYEIFKNYNSNYVPFVNYDVWNEGIKTPFVLNMVLDQIIAAAYNYAESNNLIPNNDLKKGGQNYKNVMNWGEYWTKEFIS